MAIVGHPPSSRRIESRVESEGTCRGWTAAHWFTHSQDFSACDERARELRSVTITFEKNASDSNIESRNVLSRSWQVICRMA